MKTLRLFLWLSILTGVVYPLLVTLIAHIFFHEQATGSLMREGDELKGSFLLAQKFSSPRYFWPRPSAVNYQTLPSGGSNFGPISQALQKTVSQRREHYGQTDVPAELLYASGSGLDPHLSREAILFQVERVAQARGLASEVILEKIGAQRLVNVLELNLWLDSIHE